MRQSQMYLKNPLFLRATVVVCISILTFSFATCSGGSGNNIGPCVTCGTVSSHYVYTANAADGTITALSSDKSSGALASISGSPYPTGTAAWALAASPATGRIYVANILSGDIAGFTVDVTTGKLSALAGSPFPAETGVNSLAIDPAGKFLYAVSQNSANLRTFSISSSGALTPISGTPLVINAWPGSVSSSVIIDPSGNYLYATTMTSGTAALYGFSRDPTTGGLTSLAFAPVLYGLANKTAFDVAGKVLLVTGTQVFGTAGGVEVFLYDSSTGGVVAGLGSPNQVGVDPSGAVVDASGKYVYVPNTADATISAFVLDSTNGGLTAVPGSPFLSGGNGSINGPHGIATDTSGHFVFVCNASNDISVFSINSATGALSPVAGSPFPADGNGPSAIAFMP